MKCENPFELNNNKSLLDVILLGVIDNILAYIGAGALIALFWEIFTWWIERKPLPVLSLDYTIQKKDKYTTPSLHGLLVIPINIKTQYRGIKLYKNLMQMNVLFNYELIRNIFS